MKRNLLHALMGVALAMTTSTALAQDVTENLSVKSDVSLRSDAADKANATATSLEMYTTRDDANAITKDFVGLMSFQVPVKAGYSVKSATLKLVTERAKGDLAIYALGADVSDADTYNSQKENIAAARENSPLVVQRLNGTWNKATFDGGASENYEDWVNNIDLTEYVQSVSTGKINLLLVNNAKNSSISIQVYTSDAISEKLKDNQQPKFTFGTDDLKPALTVVYEKDENQKVSTSTSIADTWVYRGNSGTFGSQDAVELSYELNEDNSVKKEIDAMMSFQLPALAVSSDYEIENVTLRLVAERVKGDKNVNVYGYEAFEENTNFANEESKIATAKTDDNLILTFEAKGASTAMPFDELADEYKTVDAWTNNLDLTEYAKKLVSRDIHLLLTRATNSGESIKFFSREVQDVTNASDATLVFKKEDLQPQLTVVYKKIDATGISDVITETVSTSDAIYNLQGVRMNGKNLPVGIYVKNGKKFIVK